MITPIALQLGPQINNMSVIKNIGKKIIEAGFEEVKESAREVGEQITGQKKDEVGEYLKKLDPNLSKEEIEKIQRSDLEKLEQTRRMLRSTVPEHMKLPPQPKEPRPHERSLQERQEKEKELQEAQKRQEALSLPLIIGKQRGKLGAAKRPKTTDFERGKNIKVG